MIKGLYTPLDWCNALTARDPMILEHLCNSVEACACVNDHYIFLSHTQEARKARRPLKFAIQNEVPMHRIRLLVERAGARITLSVLYVAMHSARIDSRELFLYLISLGPHYNYATWRHHFLLLSTKEEKIKFIQQNTENARKYCNDGKLFRKALKRLNSAREVATAVIGLHRKTPEFQNKDVLRIIGQQVVSQASNQKWKHLSSSVYKWPELVEDCFISILLSIFSCVVAYTAKPELYQGWTGWVLQFLFIAASILIKCKADRYKLN